MRERGFDVSDDEPVPDLHWPEMRVQDVQVAEQRTVVETTGAVFTIHHADPGKIAVVQKLNGPRPLFEMDFATSFERMSLDYRDGQECTLYTPVSDIGFNVRIFADSLLWVRSGKEVRVKTSGDWLPEYSYTESGNALLLDENGGCGHYVLPSPLGCGSSATKPEPGISFTARGWEIRYTLPGRRLLLACVAPPRPFNHPQACGDRVVHHFLQGAREDRTWYPYPHNDTIKRYAKVGNILTLHWWSHGAGPSKGLEVASREDIYALAAPWAARRHEPLDEQELRRVIDTAHAQGMRVLPYISPLYFPGTGKEFLEDLERVLETYGFDGVYFDGVSEDILEAYEIMKGTRRMLGRERLLYVHVPSPILGSSYFEGRYAYCPFIDTYADFILRAEHIEDFDDATLRYTVSGYNISNAIGLTCNYDYSLEFNKALIHKALDYHVRVPYWTGWDLYLADRGKALGKQYPREAEIHEIMEREYFPALDRTAASS